MTDYTYSIMPVHQPFTKMNLHLELFHSSKEIRFKNEIDDNLPWNMILSKSSLDALPRKGTISRKTENMNVVINSK